MAYTKDDTKSLEMRVAAIEDKLSKMSVSEEELQRYQKVISLMADANASRQPCIAATCISSIRNPIRISIPVPVHIPIIINDCIQAGASGPVASTGFGALGT